MPEPTDVIVPILLRIQADIAETKRDLARKIDANSAALAHQDEKLDTLEGYLTYQFGMV